MSFIDTLLKRLEETQADLAKQALMSPQGRDAFEYGRMAGIYAGVDTARTIVMAMLDDQDAKDKDL